MRTTPHYLDASQQNRRAWARPASGTRAVTARERGPPSWQVSSPSIPGSALGHGTPPHLRGPSTESACSARLSAGSLHEPTRTLKASASCGPRSLLSRSCGRRIFALCPPPAAFPRSCSAPHWALSPRPSRYVDHSPSMRVGHTSYTSRLYTYPIGYHGRSASAPLARSVSCSTPADPTPPALRQGRCSCERPSARPRRCRRGAQGGAVRCRRHGVRR